MKIYSEKWDFTMFSVILLPVSYIVSIFFGVTFEYHENLGFFNNELGIIITKGCSGINFFMILLSVLIFAFISKVKAREKVFIIFIIPIIAYIITVLANSSRIIASVHILRLNIPLFTRYHGLVHQSTGVVFYFTFLMITYTAFSKAVEFLNHEKGRRR